MPRRLKGQFFILGAMLLCTLFFLGLPQIAVHSAPRDTGLSPLADNLEREIPHALNLALAEDQDTQKLGEFLDFARNNSAERYSDMEALWVVILPDPGNPGYVSLEAGNWLGRRVSLYLSVDGDGQEIELDDTETASLSFTGLPEAFDMTVSFGGREWSGQASLGKAGIYCYLSLGRGENAVVRDFHY